MFKIEDEETPKEKLNGGEEKVVANNYFEVTGFPSRGKFYPAGTVVQARPLKVLEVKLLSSLNEENFDKTVNEVLKRTVRGIGVDDLLVADKYYLIFWLRANTYKDSGYTMKFDCPHCRETRKTDDSSEYSFALSSLDVDFLDEGFDFSKEFELPSCKAKLLFRLPTIKDEQRAEFFKNSSTNKKFDADLLSVANVITSVNGTELSLLQKYEFLENLHPGDYVYVESYVESFDIGISDTINATCNNCGGVSPVGVSFRKDFFFPKVVIR